jgi:DNA-directed RNA polymerase specialized sigma24 family protein
MEFCLLSPEEDDLLDMLERKRPHDRDHFNVLVERLVERHWDDLLAYIGKRSFGDGISARTITADTFVKAIELLAQQITQPLHALPNDSPMIYSRAKCPHFLGFVKALARWKHLEEIRKTRRYCMRLDTFVRQEDQKTREYGTLRLNSSEERMPLRTIAPLDDLATTLWENVRKLPSRESLVIQLYCQHGPVPLAVHGLAELAAYAGLTAQEIRALQKRFRKLVHRQPTKTIRHLTHDQIAALFDVNRETIRRIFAMGKKRLRGALEAECLQTDIPVEAGRKEPMRLEA